MPTYMCRHESEGATPRAVAADHQKDVDIQAQFDVQCFTYWFDQGRQSIFCLMDAPSPEAVQELHESAHGKLANEIIEVDRASIAAFLGRTADPEDVATTPIRDSAFRAIMFTDMENSTEITNQLGDRAALVLFNRHHAIVRDALAAHAGREVDRAGDGFLTCFRSTCDGVECAISIQRNLKALNESAAEVPIRVRIGIGAGEPVDDGDSLFGTTVNLTSRICNHAKPEQILAASVVRELCAERSFGFRDYGEVELKGFPDPVRLHEIEWR